MINVYDPLFKLEDNLPPALTEEDERNAVEGIGNAMGYTSISEAFTYQDVSELDNLYNDDCSVVIPIVNEKVQEGVLPSALPPNYNTSYLVITPKSGEIPPNSTSQSEPKYSYTGSDGAITDNSHLVNPRMVNFRFYRNRDDTHPIIYDALQGVYYGYKEDEDEETHIKTHTETQICFYGINIFLKQQVIQFKYGYNFPFYPTDSENYMVSNDNIKQIGEDNANFDPSLVNVNLNPITNSLSLCCHITGRFYILSQKVN